MKRLLIRLLIVGGLLLGSVGVFADEGDLQTLQDFGDTCWALMQAERIEPSDITFVEDCHDLKDIRLDAKRLEAVRQNMGSHHMGGRHHGMGH